MQKYRQIIKVRKANRLLGTIRVNWPPADIEARQAMLDDFFDAFTRVDPSQCFTLDSTFYPVKPNPGRPQKKWN